MNVLGTEYKVEFHNEQDDYMRENNLQGYCDFIKKEIHVLRNENKNVAYAHETIHAFLYESGIDYGMQFHNEECVDWMAHQMQKIHNAMNTAGTKY